MNNLSIHLFALLFLLGLLATTPVFAQIPGENLDGSVMATSINITNNTNSTGAAAGEMVDSTSNSNMSSGQRTNWLAVCKTPIIDSVIDQPCEALTTPDGFHLSPEGIRIFACTLGAGKLMEYDPTGSKTAEAREMLKGIGIC